MKRFEHLIIDPFLATSSPGLWLNPHAGGKSRIAMHYHLSLYGLLRSEEWYPQLKSIDAQRAMLNELATVTGECRSSGSKIHFDYPNGSTLYLYLAYEEMDEINGTVPEELAPPVENVLSLWQHLYNTLVGTKQDNLAGQVDLVTIRQEVRESITVLTDNPITTIFCHAWRIKTTSSEAVNGIKCSEGFTD